MKSQIPPVHHQPIGSSRCVKIQQRGEFYHRVSWYYNMSETNTVLLHSTSFRPRPFPIIKNTRPQWGKLFFFKAPISSRLVPSLLFQGLPGNRRWAKEASRILPPYRRGHVSASPTRQKITPSLVCKKCDVLMEENEEPCKGQVSAVSDTGPAGPAMSNAMLKKE